VSAGAASGPSGSARRVRTRRGKAGRECNGKASKECEDDETKAERKDEFQEQNHSDKVFGSEENSSLENRTRGRRVPMRMGSKKKAHTQRRERREATHGKRKERFRLGARELHAGGTVFHGLERKSGVESVVGGWHGGC
jgi:hypothetical protein